MDLALNNLQRLICHKIQPTNQSSRHKLHLPGGARSVIVIIVGNEHGDTSSNPGRNSLHFT